MPHLRAPVQAPAHIEPGTWRKTMNFIYVAIGGAVGACLRYAISLIPAKTTFPILTLITNVIGALIIGLIVGLSVKHNMSENLILLLKTGLCGGFTTFSTFSLEAYNLFKDGKPGMGIIYAILSLGLCIAAVFAGEKIAG